jgi:hypothetical protein
MSVATCETLLPCCRAHGVEARRLLQDSQQLADAPRTLWRSNDEERDPRTQKGGPTGTEVSLIC